MKVQNRNINIVHRSNNTLSTPKYFGDALLFGHYSNIDPLLLSAVFAAVEIISNSIASMPIQVKQYAEGARTVIRNHYVYDLFNNLRQTRFMFIKQLVWDMIINGNGYAYIKRDDSGKAVDLIYLPANNVSIMGTPQTDDIYYLCSGYKNVPDKIYEDDIIHLFKNTRDGVHGISVLSYAAETIKTAGYAEKSASDYFGSGCSIKGILKFNSYRDDEQKDAARSSWNQVHGQGGSGLAIMDADCDFMPVTQSANDSQLLSTRQFNVNEIARFFNISPVLLQDLSHSSYNTIEAANLEFVQHTLMPYIRLIEEELNRKLMFVKDLYIDIDENTLLKGDKLSTAGYIRTLKDGGVITTNEAREIIDMNPIDGGDEIIIPYTDIAANTIGGNEEK
jgi:HK97 family phage portal protein